MVTDCHVTPSRVHSKSQEEARFETSSMFGMEPAFACIVHSVESYLALDQVGADQGQFDTDQHEHMKRRT